jgi:catechol 2,3-dioxygenase-like lactoylglutathione lyase family enzyme
MLKDKTSSAIVGVSDIDRAREFYGETLGLQPAGGGDEEGVLAFQTGSSQLTVYRSDGLRPSTANAVAWGAGGDVEAIARDLTAKGVTLEEYPDMGLEIENGVHRDGDFRGIWFKDPDGNILHVNSM